MDEKAVPPPGYTTSEGIAEVAISEQEARPPGYTFFPSIATSQHVPQPAQTVNGSPCQFNTNATLDMNQNQEKNMRKLQQIAVQFEIQPAFIAKLRKLENFLILLVLDDSGSMNHVLTDDASTSNPDATQKTRWNQLCESATAICDVALKVSSGQELREALNAFHPDGYSELLGVIRYIFDEKAAEILERKCLVLLFTDGSPTNIQGFDDNRSFYQEIKNRHPNIFMTIVSCSDSLNGMAYLNRLDREIPRLDVVQDYRSEITEIRRSQGPNFRFSFGDYIVKCLLGSIDDSFDRLNEGKKKCIVF